MPTEDYVSRQPKASKTWALVDPAELAALRAATVLRWLAWVESAGTYYVPTYMVRTMVTSGCPTCMGRSRETVGLVCQTCGTDYGEVSP